MEEITRALRDAEAALERGVEAPWNSIDDDSLVEIVRLSEQVGRRLDSVRISAAAQVQERSRRELGDAGLSRRFGYSRGSHLIEAVGRVSSAAAARAVRVGAAVGPRMSPAGVPLEPLFPALADAIGRGDVGMDTAAHVVRNLVAASDRCAVDDLAAAERALVEEAVVLGPDLVADQARVWRDHLDTDGSEPRCERQHRQRCFTIGRERDDGMTPYSGLADPVAAGILRATIRARRAIPRMLDANDAEAADADAEASADDANAADADADADDADAVILDERSFEQRDFDAFMGLITAGIHAGDGVSRGGRASVVATVSLAELRDGVGVGWLDDVRESVAVGMIDELACDAGYEIAVTNDAGAIVSLTSPRRYFTRRQRRALAARDGGCVFPGCRAPTSWTDAHHVVEHENGGPTDVSNGALLCPEHHHYMHSGRYRLKMVRGRPHLLAPPHLDPDQRWRPVGKSQLEKRQALGLRHDHGRNRPEIR